MYSNANLMPFGRFLSSSFSSICFVVHASPISGCDSSWLVIDATSTVVVARGSTSAFVMLFEW